MNKVVLVLLIHNVDENLIFPKAVQMDFEMNTSWLDIATQSHRSYRFSYVVGYWGACCIAREHIIHLAVHMMGHCQSATAIDVFSFWFRHLHV